MTFNPFSRWQGKLLAFFLFALFFFLIGAYMALVRHYMAYDALARMVSAYLVWYGKEIKMATIGFVWPPVPTLLLLPLSFIKELVYSWLAVAIVSAVAMSAACIAIDRIAQFCGLSRFWRLVTVLLFALNPLIVVFASNGMSEAILIAVTLAGCYWLLRFWESDRNMHLLMASGCFSLLPLIRYEAVVLTIGAALLIFLQTWMKGRKRYGDAEFRDYVEGRLLGYSGLAIYPLFLWAVSSWFIMGNPLYFLLNDRSALSLAEYQLGGSGGLVTGPIRALGAVFFVWVGAYPMVLVASIAASVIGFAKKNYYLIGLGIFVWLIPLTQYLLLTRNASVPLLRYFIMAIPLGFVLILACWKIAAGILPNGLLKRKNLIVLGGALLLLLSNFSTYWMLENYQFQTVEKDSWRALTTQEDLGTSEVDEAIGIGEALNGIIPEGSRVLIDTYQAGFAVVLGAENPEMFFDFTDSNYDEAVKNPPAYVDYVLVPKAEERGAFYSINRVHPRLHEQGALWAELIEELPPTTLQWRLYKVKR